MITLALVIGMLLVGYDRGTDDTGVEATFIVLISLLLALLAPRVALAIALAVALPMAAFNGSFPGLAFSSIGAVLGAALRRSAVATRTG